MRTMVVSGTNKKIPPFPHHKDYVLRCKHFFEAKSILSFVSIAKFRVIKEAYYGFKYKCAIPRDILIDPTNACNLKCIGCWANDYDPTHLSYEKLDEIITEAQKLGTMDILMTGGEPLLRKKDILSLAEKHRNLYFGIFTNGHLIDKEFVEQIVQLGNVSTFISIEGFEEDTDFRRGKGSYQTAISKMELLKAYDIGFGFSICYHKKNYKSVTSDEFLDFLREKGSWFGWAFGYRPIGNDADMSLCLNADERIYVRKTINDYCKRHDFTIIDLFNNGHQAYGCVGAGNGYIHINANGDVEPCAFCHYSDANLHEMSLQKALQSPFFRAFRNRQPFSENPMQPCPMYDVPEAIVTVANKTGAKSTHLSSPESPEDFANKVNNVANDWDVVANKEFETLSRDSKRRFRFLLKYLSLKQWLSGDLKAK